MANKKVAAFTDLALLDPDGAFPQRLADDRAALVAWLWDMQTGNSGTFEEKLKQIATLSHRLAGAAGTFGYAEVSDTALLLEDLILDRAPGQTVSVWLGRVSHAANALVRTIDDGLLAIGEGHNNALPLKVSFRSG